MKTGLKLARWFSVLDGEGVETIPPHRRAA
jgi:hypothetical protein